MPHTMRALGVHSPTLMKFPGGYEVGSYAPGNLQTFYSQVGFNPLDLPPAERPLITLKIYSHAGYLIPDTLTNFAKDVVALGCWLHIQDMEYWPEEPGPTTGETEHEWMRDNLPTRIQILNDWIVTIQANRLMTYVSYGNEFEMAANPDTGRDFIWNGQPGSTDIEGEYFHREAAFMELVASRLGCLTAFANDAAPVGLMRRLPRRLEIYGAWGVKPAAMVYHGYATPVGGHTEHHIPLLLATARAAGFRGRLIGGEVARRIHTDEGNEADRDASGEWWRRYADEVTRHPDLWACFFNFKQAIEVPQILAAFKSPVPTGADTDVDGDEVATQAWGIKTALLPEAERELDLGGAVEGLRAARDAM